MTTRSLPAYAVFDEHRHSQQIAVMVRWFLLGAWLAVNNYRNEFTSTLVLLDALGFALAAANGYLHWRIWKGRPVTRPYVIALSLMDLTILSVGIGVTNRFGNTFFVLYYPALLGLALVFSSRRFNFGVVTVVAGAYAGMSTLLSPGVAYSMGEEKVLILRILCMFAVVAAANLMARIERNRRQEAVAAERVLSARNLELQKRAAAAELAAAEERHRIAREIHDGIAQSIYGLSLSLETCADIAEAEKGPLRERLSRLVPLAKQTLLEVRHYIYDLKPLLSGERDLIAMAENQVREFQTVTRIPATLSARGEPGELSVGAATACYRILQEALANTLKHARASKVDVELMFETNSVSLSVRDNGKGFAAGDAAGGYGIDNMRSRSLELGGTFDIQGAPGGGTRVTATLPA